MLYMISFLSQMSKPIKRRPKSASPSPPPAVELTESETPQKLHSFPRSSTPPTRREPKPLTHLRLKHGDSASSFGSVYSEAGVKGDYDISGEVRVGVYYKDGQLLVHVNKARALAAANSNGFSNPYVKTYLFPDKSKHSKRKTTIKRKTLDPVYNETLKVSLLRPVYSVHCPDVILYLLHSTCSLFVSFSMKSPELSWNPALYG